MKIAIPKGFKAAGVHAGFKKKPDFAMVVCDEPCDWAGVFTANKMAAAPVKDCEAKLGGKVKAVIVNSGMANACTGKKGATAVEESCKIAAKTLQCPEKQILQASTGVIGQPLDVSKIGKGIGLAMKSVGSGKKDFLAAAKAIMTTDKWMKVSSAEMVVGGKKVALFGMAKGAGMINPCMATMLCFLMTDAAVEKKELQAALEKAVGKTFNSISVDGETSTNDSVILIASGRAGNEEIKAGSGEAEKFENALEKVCLELALEIVSDGEGATKLLEVVVSGAANGEDAEKAAAAVVNSLLVKTALAGGDPNWGRIASAAGASGALVEEEKTSVSICGVTLYEKGEPTGKEAAAAKKMKKKKIVVEVELGLGSGGSKKWGCDLGQAYVALNSKYHT